MLRTAAHASNLSALDVSADGHALVAVGADSVARQMIALWDIRDVRSTGKVGATVDTAKHSPIHTAGLGHVPCPKGILLPLCDVSFSMPSCLSRR
jgi:hypothetical protein